MPMLACSACTPVVTKFPVPDAAKADAVPVTDRRPASVKESKNDGLLITSKRCGILRRIERQLRCAEWLRRWPMSPAA